MNKLCPHAAVTFDVLMFYGGGTRRARGRERVDA